MYFMYITCSYLLDVLASYIWPYVLGGLIVIVLNVLFKQLA